MPSDRRERSGSAGSARSNHSRASSSMGQDGGEAGRRMAAEDEFIRSELQETNSFCNAFWGFNDTGFAVVQSRMKGSTRVIDDLRALYKERAEIEAEYAKRLSKLAKQSYGKDETGSMRAAIDVVRMEIETTARTHSDLGSLIRKDLEGQLGEFANKAQAQRKNSIAQIEKLYKQKQTQESYVAKSREKYEQDCIKINGYTAQSSLVQGRDLEKVNSKLDKAQATVSGNDKDYQNFVRALKDTTHRWNTEWKAYLDQCQDVEEERMDFLKGNLWNYANAISAVCVADDEGCERVRVALESCESSKDVLLFIQRSGTGSAIPDPPEYINYAKGQPPPARPLYRMANFHRTTTRSQSSMPTVPPLTSQIAISSSQQGAEMTNSSSVKASEEDPLRSRKGSSSSQHPPPPPPNQPDGSDDRRPFVSSSTAASRMVGPLSGDVPSMVLQQNEQAPEAANSSTLSGTEASENQDGIKVEKRMSARNFLARTSSTNAHPRAELESSAQEQERGGSGAREAIRGDEDVDPIAKALAELRARPGSKSPAISGPTVGAPPPIQKSPRAMPSHLGGPGRPDEQRGSTPFPSQQNQERSRSPSAAFMQAPERAASPMPVEEVLDQYGQSFPGERRSLSRQNSTASTRTSQDLRSKSTAPSGDRIVSNVSAGMGATGRAPSPQPPMSLSGFAGVGARGRSPSPQPGSRSSFRAPTSPHKQVQIPASQQSLARPTTPLGISLDASGSVTHDEMADHFRRSGSVGPGQQGSQHPGSTSNASPFNQQKQSIAGYPGHQPQSSVGSQYNATVLHQHQPQHQQQHHPHQQHYPQQQQSAFSRSDSLPAQRQQSTYNDSGPMHNQAPPGPQYSAYAGASSSSAPLHSQSPAPQSQHLQQQILPQQSFNQQQSPSHISQNVYGYNAQYPQGISSHAQETPAPYQYQQSHATPTPPPTASAPVGQYQHQQPPPQVHAQQLHQQTSPLAAVHAQPVPPPQQQLSQWSSQPYGGAPTPAPQQMAAQSQPAPPTGQFSDAGKPILFYVKALYDYQATLDEEFNFTAGDIIAVWETNPDGWWQGELLDDARRRAGSNTFPSNFVSLLN